eukprot:11165253-Lingulodinium_polyedra.AAC.1
MQVAIIPETENKYLIVKHLAFQEKVRLTMATRLVQGLGFMLNFGSRVRVGPRAFQAVFQLPG